jgi:hypothetical protein
LLILAAGIFFLPAPGPGTVIVVIGGALVAQESFWAAWALDWAELRLRALYQRGIRAWKRASSGK